MIAITSNVKKLLQEEGITEVELQHMLEKSAVTSSRGCNRRYFHWLFLIRDEKNRFPRLIRMMQAEPVEVGKGCNRQTVEHEECLGMGCKACGWAGTMVRLF